jgi:chemotaxis protein methyltransferase CheR
LGLKDLSDYRALLVADAAEWRQLDGLCWVSISRFYRDQGVWRWLERNLLPQLVAQASVRGETRLRIWSAGCASGEEPYTLALIFALADMAKSGEPEILATDADPHLLARARRACYPGSSLRELPAKWRAAFERSGDEFCLSPEYRTQVRFLAQDIRRDLPDGRFDLVLCRNLVFTYFQASLQAVIAGRLAEVLVPGGLLLLGSHESLPEAVSGLVQERPWLYRRETA